MVSAIVMLAGQTGAAPRGALRTGSKRFPTGLPVRRARRSQLKRVQRSQSQTHQHPRRSRSNGLMNRLPASQPNSSASKTGACGWNASRVQVTASALHPQRTCAHNATAHGRAAASGTHTLQDFWPLLALVSTAASDILHAPRAQDNIASAARRPFENSRKAGATTGQECPNSARRPWTMAMGGHRSAHGMAGPSRHNKVGTSRRRAPIGDFEAHALHGLDCRHGSARSSPAGAVMSPDHVRHVRRPTVSSLVGLTSPAAEFCSALRSEDAHRKRARGPAGGTQLTRRLTQRAVRLACESAKPSGCNESPVVSRCPVATGTAVRSSRSIANLQASCNFGFRLLQERDLHGRTTTRRLEVLTARYTEARAGETATGEMNM